VDTDARTGRVVTPNGGALAAVLAAGIGALAMGLFVIANEAGIFAAPSLHGPSGGLSGRSTFAVIVCGVSTHIRICGSPRRIRLYVMKRFGFSFSPMSTPCSASVSQ